MKKRFNGVYKSFWRGEERTWPVNIWAVVVISIGRVRRR